MSFDLTFNGRLSIPLIVAPMFLVSSPELALAACSRGVIGSFPAHSTRTREMFQDWLQRMDNGFEIMERQGFTPAPYAVNLVVHKTNARYQGDLDLCIEHKVPVILTSKGAPKNVFEKIHDYGGVVFHDVASKRHAEKAIEAGADAIIAVCGGAGGHTGTINPFALVNEIREVTDKPIIVSGSLNTGRDILAAQAMGANMAYMGTRFIATPESLVEDSYRQMLIKSSAKDIFYTEALDGFPSNWLAPSLINSGIDLEQLAAGDAQTPIDAHALKARYKTIWSAGQGVGMIKKIMPAAKVCDQLVAEYEEAKACLRELI
jgi:nitronate monooxygenase